MLVDFSGFCYNWCGSECLPLREFLGSLVNFFLAIVPALIPWLKFGRVGLWIAWLFGVIIIPSALNVLFSY